jgi:HSP20 family molecular chaperone IbpA
MYWEDTCLVLDARMSGYNNEEVRVQFRDRRVLQIVVESQRRGSFMKSVQLPENVNVGQLKTEFDHGMLKITMPKLNMKPKKKNPPIIVTVSGRHGCFFC